MEAQGREPTPNELRDHVDEVASTVRWRELYDWHPPREPTEEEREGQLDGMASVAPTVPGPRRPGRPGRTAEVCWANYRAACARSGPPCTYRTVPVHFDSLDGVRGIDPDHLRKLLRRVGPSPA